MTGRFLRTVVLVAAAALFAVPSAGAAELADYPVVGGRFFTQTGQGGGRGYAVTDVDGISFWSTFRSAGGVAPLGYPISSRWNSGEFTLQAFQRGILQWSDGGGMAFLNIYDELAAGGYDDWLDGAKGVPRSRMFPEEAGRPFADILQGRLAILDATPAIRDAWFSNPRWLDLYGLPVASEDRGGVIVLRAQRAVFHEWIDDTPFNAAGDVIIASGGDHYKQAGLIPSDATKPQDALPRGGMMGAIAFVSDRGGQWDLHTMAPDGSGIRRITNLREVYGRPSWSADGSRLAFTSWINGSYEVFIVNADGTDLRQLTSSPATDWEPWLSPDGSQVSFISTREGGVLTIFLMNADGTEPRRITRSAGAYCYPTWSPDGATLLYELGGVLGIMRLDGAPIDGLAQKPLFAGTDPAWSPDGDQIALARYVDGNYEIFIVNLDGGNERRLTHHPAQEANPSFSPDGTTIAFSSYRDGNWEIYTVGVDGTDLKRITNDPATDFQPTWGS